MHKPTGINFSEWEFGNGDILKPVEVNTAEIVVRQILSDLKNEVPTIHNFDSGVKIAVQLIEGEDAWAFFAVDSLHIDEDLTGTDSDAIIAALVRLIDRCNAMRTETAQKRPIASESNVNENGTEGDSVTNKPG